MKGKNMEFKFKELFHTIRGLCILNTTSLIAISLMLLLPPSTEQSKGILCLFLSMISIYTNIMLANFSKLYVENSNEEKKID